MFFHSSQLLYGDQLRARREALRAVLSSVVHESGVINHQPGGRRDSMRRLEGSAARIVLTIRTFFMLASRVGFRAGFIDSQKDIAATA
jgi:hypothetical protein